MKLFQKPTPQEAASPAPKDKREKVSLRIEVPHEDWRTLRRLSEETGLSLRQICLNGASRILVDRGQRPLISATDV